MHYKVREEGRIVTKASYVALGINAEGRKDILGIWIGENEGAKFWLKVCNELKNRGVKDILIACIDGLQGFPDAIKTVFPETRIQLCIIHQIRNTMKYIAYKDSKAFMKDLKRVNLSTYFSYGPQIRRLIYTTYTDKKTMPPFLKNSGSMRISREMSA